MEFLSDGKGCVLPTDHMFKHTSNQCKYGVGLQADGGNQRLGLLIFSVQRLFGYILLLKKSAIAFDFFKFICYL